MTLPGIGPYTAAAIQAFVYDEKILSFDTNLEKIFSRYYYGTRFQKMTPSEKIQIEKDFQASRISGRAINAAFMDLGSFGDTREAYPLKECKWHRTGGALEIQEKKKKMVFPTKDASIIVVLHENHRIHFSSEKWSYHPFTLTPTEEDIRQSVQAYFREKYNLELSVRPIHKKYFENDAPFMICNAQVQKGEVGFQSYRKENWIFVENR